MPFSIFSKKKVKGLTPSSVRDANGEVVAIDGDSDVNWRHFACRVDVGVNNGAITMFIFGMLL